MAALGLEGGEAGWEVSEIVDGGGDVGTPLLCSTVSASLSHSGSSHASEAWNGVGGSLTREALAREALALTTMVIASGAAAAGDEHDDCPLDAPLP